MAEVIMIDFSMTAARLLAEGLGPAVPLPESLRDVKKRAQFVNEIDGPFLSERGDAIAFHYIGTRLGLLARTSLRYMPGIKDGLARLNIVLRLWAGCISAAKVIALETRSGPNTPESRTQSMLQIEQIADHDPIYAAGVEAAPALKRLRGEEYSFDGIPPGSKVLPDQGPFMQTRAMAKKKRKSKKR